MRAGGGAKEEQNGIVEVGDGVRRKGRRRRTDVTRKPSDAEKGKRKKSDAQEPERRGKKEEREEKEKGHPWQQEEGGMTCTSARER